MIMARKKKAKKNTKRLLLLGFGSIVIIIVTTFTIGRYWVDIYEKYQERKVLEQKLEELKEKEAILRVDADKLQDPDYIARYAREKYLYSKEGEIILQMK